MDDARKKLLLEDIKECIENSMENGYDLSDFTWTHKTIAGDIFDCTSFKENWTYEEILEAVKVLFPTK